MSAELDRFIEDTKQDGAIHTFLLSAARSDGDVFENISNFAGRFGYSFSGEEFREYTRQVARDSIRSESTKIEYIEAIGFSIIASSSVRVCCCNFATSSMGCKI